MTIFLIQFIETCWTKESRGGRVAGIRNATPEALPLKTAARPKGDISTIIHTVRYGEKNLFAAPLEDKVESKAGFPGAALTLLGPPSVLIGSFGLYPTEDQVRVSLQWSEWISPRRRPIREIAVVKKGEWARCRCNFRVGGAHEWTWYKQVINVALVPEYKADLFTASKPRAIESFMGL